MGVWWIIHMTCFVFFHNINIYKVIVVCYCPNHLLNLKILKKVTRWEKLVAVGIRCHRNRLKIVILIPFKNNDEMIIIFKYSLFEQDIRLMD